MEMFLKELGVASKILSDFQDMYEYENRLKTFTSWPFTENCKCTPENVSLKTVIWLYFIFQILLLNVRLLLSIFMFKKSCELLLSLKKMKSWMLQLFSVPCSETLQQDDWLLHAWFTSLAAELKRLIFLIFFFFSFCQLELKFLYYEVFLSANFHS